MKDTQMLQITEVNSLMMFREVIAAYFMNGTIAKCILCGRRVGFLKVEADVYLVFALPSGVAISE
jgi:hypothetical protein